MKGERGRGTLAKEKPPIFGMIQRTGEVVIGEERPHPDAAQPAPHGLGGELRAIVRPDVLRYTAPDEQVR